MLLFFDANTLFSAAHNPKGKAALVVQLGADGQWGLYTSNYALEEARRNLEAKFPAALNEFVRLAASFQTGPESRVHQCPKALSSKDCPIYLAAHCCRATHLLTGDIRNCGSLTEVVGMGSGTCKGRSATLARFCKTRPDPGSIWPRHPPRPGKALDPKLAPTVSLTPIASGV